MTRPQLRTGSGIRPAAAFLAFLIIALTFSALILDQPWWASPLAIAAFLVAIVGHETAHGLAASSRGLCWTALILGPPGAALAGAEITDPDDKPRTNLDQLVISLAGPLVEAACGALVVTAARTLPEVTYYLGLIGVCIILDGALQLLVIPIKNSDGHKAAVAAWRCLHHQAHSTWA